MAENTFLENLVQNTPVPPEAQPLPKAQQDVNIAALLADEPPPGFDFAQYVADFVADQGVEDAQVQATSAMISASAESLSKNYQDVNALASDLYGATDAAQEAADRNLQTTRELETAELQKILGIEAELGSLIQQRKLDSAQTEADYNAALEATMEDLNAIEEANNLRFGDFLRNPFNFIAKYDRMYVAQNDMQVNSSKLQALNAKLQYDGQVFAERTGNLRVQAELREAEHVGKYLQQLETQQLLNQANSDRSFALQDFENAGVVFGFSRQALDTATTAMQALQAKGNVRESQVRAVMLAAQAETATAQAKLLRKQVQTNAELATALDPAYAEAAGFYGHEALDSMDKVLTAHQTGAISDEHFLLIQHHAQQKGLAAENLFNSPDVKASIAAMEANGMEVPDTLKSVVANVTSWINPTTGQALLNSQEYITGDAKTRARLEVETLRTWRTAVETNVDVLFDDLANVIHSPDKMPVDAIDGVPLAVTEEIQKWKARTASWDVWTKDMINAAAESNTSTETLARGLSAISRATLEGANRQTGLGLRNMRTPALKDGLGNNGNSLNPADYQRAIERRRAEIQSRKVQLANLANVTAGIPILGNVNQIRSMVAGSPNAIIKGQDPAAPPRDTTP